MHSKSAHDTGRSSTASDTSDVAASMAALAEIVGDGAISAGDAARQGYTNPYFLYPNDSPRCMRDRCLSALRRGLVERVRVIDGYARTYWYRPTRKAEGKE